MFKMSKTKTVLSIVGVIAASAVAYRFVPGFANAVNNTASKAGDLASKAGGMIGGGAAAAGDAVMSVGESIADVTVSAS